LFTAVDKEKRFVTTIRQEDLRILEDGAPQEIFTFERQTDLGLSLAILIDLSGSQERTLPAEKIAARAFINSVIRLGKDEAAVISFAGEATLEQSLTSSTAQLRQAIDRVNIELPSGYTGGGIPVGSSTPPISGTDQSVAGSTALWDAVWVTAGEVLSRAPGHTRRAIILLTDGVDTSSQKEMKEAIDLAVKSDVVIYAIGIGDPDYDGVDEGKLRKVSERTGGRAFFPRDAIDLRAAFAQIEQEMRSQYLIAYSPANKRRDGSFRKVKIEIVNSELRKQKLRLTYRQGYYVSQY
jgi:VWFA-related protein